MWFVEFEIAEDALAMLHYTRGRNLRGVPIAARLKSNTLLTGGEYKAMPIAPSNLGGSGIPVFPPMHGWPHSPPDTDHEASFGMSMPYRRFPADENYVGQEAWTPIPTPGLLAHGSAIVHCPPGTYLSPSFQGPVPFAVPANPYCRYYTKMWLDRENT